MRILLGLAVLLLVACDTARAATPPANMAEVSVTLATVIKTANQGDEALIEVFSAALEVEKKATVPEWAASIAANIRKATGLSPKDFTALRSKHAFFDLAVGCAVSKATKMPLALVMQEREVSLWQEILPKRFGKEKARFAAAAADILTLLP